MKNFFLTIIYSIVLSACSNAQSMNKNGPRPYTDVAPAPTTATEIDSPTPPTSSMKDKASSCTCVKMWMPVCGENKRTYGNSCEADCAGVKYTVGACALKK